MNGMGNFREFKKKKKKVGPFFVFHYCRKDIVYILLFLQSN